MWGEEGMGGGGGRYVVLFIVLKDNQNRQNES